MQNYSSFYHSLINHLERGVIFYLTRPLLLGEIPTFSKTPPSPLNLKRGSTAFP